MRLKAQVLTDLVRHGLPPLLPSTRDFCSSSRCVQHGAYAIAILPAHGDVARPGHMGSCRILYHAFLQLSSRSAALDGLGRCSLALVEYQSVPLCPSTPLGPSRAVLHLVDGSYDSVHLLRLLRLRSGRVHRVRRLYTMGSPMRPTPGSRP